MKNPNPSPKPPAASSSSKPPASARRKSRWDPPPAADKPSSSSDHKQLPPHPPAANQASPSAAAPRPQPEALPLPPYGFHNLERRTLLLADGTVRSYFALPPDYPFDTAPFPPPPHFPRAADFWPPHPDAIGKRKHPADPDEGLARHPKQPRLDAPPPALPLDAGVDRHALRRAYLRYSKMLNESAAQRRSYLDGGCLQCLACGRFGDPTVLASFLGSFIVLFAVRFLCWFLNLVELLLTGV